MNILSPSILSADFANLGRDVEIAHKAGAEYIHFDVMDGAFVPNLSIGMPVLASLRKVTDAVLDVHLMIEEPGRYVEEFAKAGADIITVHAEACVHLDRTLQAIKSAGCKCGVVLNPATPLSALEYVLDKCDMVLLMSVNPGYGGQSYIPYVTKKIAALKKMIDDRELNIDIEVDGGCKLSNVKEIVDAGANVIVAGSAVFAGDIEANVKEFMKVMNS